MENKAFPTKEQYFQSKRVVITGGSGGIGNSLARMFSVLGAEVITMDINEPSPDKIRGLHIKTDLSDRQHLISAAANIEAVDILIIAAGATSQTNEPTQEEMDKMKRVNVEGVLNTLTTFEPKMKNDSQIVFIGTDNPPKDFYKQTKEEGRSLIKSFSEQHPAFNVRTILLGPVRTPLFESGKPLEVIKRIAENVGMYEPDEFALALTDRLFTPQQEPYLEEKMYRALE